MEGLPVLLEALVIIGVHAGDIGTQLDVQAGLLDARLDDGGTTHEDRMRQPFFDGELRRAQHADVLALGIGDALGVRGTRRTEHGPHEHAGGREHALQLPTVGVHVLDGPRGHARGGGRSGHGRRDAQDQARVEGLRDEVVGPEHQLLAGVGVGHFFADLGLGQVGDLAHAGELHRVGDLGGAAVQRAAEDVREAQDVVDLVRVVRTARGDDAVRARGLGQLRADLGFGIGQRQDDRLAAHGLDHVGREHAVGRATQEHIGILHGIAEGAVGGVLRVARLGLVIAARAAQVDHALGVADEHVLAADAQAHHDVQAGQRRGAGAGDHDLDRADVLAHQFQAVEQRGGRDDRRAVLVVVEHGDVEAIAQLLLDVEALGGLDVLEVDAAERGLHGGDDLDQLVGVALGQLDVEHIDASELLEQAALAFHHRLGGQRADVAQAQHGGAVGDDADQVAA